MSALAQDTYGAIIKKLGRRKRQPWQKEYGCRWTRGLKDPIWEKIHPVMIKALDEMKEHGAKGPLAQLQEIAFTEALRPDAPPQVHTAAVWLTDTRLRVEAYRSNPDDDMTLRRPLVARGILKARDSD